MGNEERGFSYYCSLSLKKYCSGMTKTCGAFFQFETAAKTK
jgi:hypothetical protein